MNAAEGVTFALIMAGAFLLVIFITPGILADRQRRNADTASVREHDAVRHALTVVQQREADSVDHYSRATTCTCGKRGYPTRREARDVEHRLRSVHGRQSAYPCDLRTDGLPIWHLGHRPAALIAGQIDRHDLTHRQR